MAVAEVVELDGVLYVRVSGLPRCHDKSQPPTFPILLCKDQIRDTSQRLISARTGFVAKFSEEPTHAGASRLRRIWLRQRVRTAH